MGLEKRKFPSLLICDFILGLDNLVHFVVMLLHKRLMHLEEFKSVDGLSS
jgi:hypothetical protein